MAIYLSVEWDGMTPQLYDGQPSDDGEADLTIDFAVK